ncbi:hypothetical protein SPRG_14549 [Saprolegnia parasitica CBS 223.65]|uniref:OTU domain-containing protein n=1 Tax=Saprolegnia parasitica (strain CBS 223.65) TaxID=695850 RepID=A0A067BMF5_SAPPC|nr:hypothetical protein SPRG_14549 [Saprolegnia parasitica CBS 223.65]KDO19649.1 hypothetical protein SPRG_14549 [Saprolegnia parasitica CBS 223.65]|eukprot:XP_012209649.1 hypothetical protein SPRG_14549 [Saprolegnia parasitica CBS 223.65]
MGREGKQRKLKRAKAEKTASKKNRGSHALGVDMRKLREQLARLELQLVTMEADGNCLFRALSDQLHGDQTHFPVIRKDIVQYIKDHQDDLEPFMEDEEALGGNLELYVASLLWQRHIVVHQVDGNRTTIDCGHAKARAWHVCYYNDEHYDSIRSVDDDLMSTPLPLPPPVTETGADTSAQRERDLKALRTDFPTMDTDELESLFEQLQCDPAKLRQKLSAKTKKAKHMVKMKKRR